MDKLATILVVDDENGIRQSFKMVLKDRFNVLLAENGKEAEELLTKNTVDLILLDILLPDINGLDLLEKLKALDPNPEAIMVTAVKEIQSAVRAIKLGAYEYIIKPFLVDDVINIINRALEKRNLMKQVTYLRNELERVRPFDEIIGKDEKMNRIFDLISSIADSDGAVLIQGESGTGKELAARAIHRLSPRKDQPFVVIACAAIPPTLVESELFGYHKGAFTGALRTTLGKLEIANRGTVFLDDIDTLDVNMQAKLLRVIQEKEFERLGTTKVIKLDVRFLACTNKELTQLIQAGAFREDLFYRLNVIPFYVPPLRERREDIPLLADYFLTEFTTAYGRKPKELTPDAYALLADYHWPGNVRELKNLMERIVIMNPQVRVEARYIPLNLARRSNADRAADRFASLQEVREAAERDYILKKLDETHGNVSRTAELLGLERSNLYRKMKALGIAPKET
jgi:DNA-binding NtrC family response regulator